MNDEYFQLYLDEIDLITPCSAEEAEILLARILKGDETAKKRLTEGSLAYTAEIAKPYSDRGLPIGDLVQEANLALILTVDSWRQGEDFRILLKTQVEAALDAAVKGQELEDKVEEEMLARVNVLKDISQQMAEELDREATAEELAGKMKMTVDEIKDIMRLTLDAMSVSPDAGE